jgi:hypothetical protein
MHFNKKSKGDSVARCNEATIFDGRNTPKRARTIFVPGGIDAKHRAYLKGKTYKPNGARECARRREQMLRKLTLGDIMSRAAE